MRVDIDKKIVLVTGASRGIGGGTVDEVAKSTVFLLSDDASYITGSFVDIAGGR